MPRRRGRRRRRPVPAARRSPRRRSTVGPGRPDRRRRRPQGRARPRRARGLPAHGGEAVRPRGSRGVPARARRHAGRCRRGGPTRARSPSDVGGRAARRRRPRRASLRDALRHRADRVRAADRAPPGARVPHRRPRDRGRRRAPRSVARGGGARPRRDRGVGGRDRACRGGRAGALRRPERRADPRRPRLHEGPPGREVDARHPDARLARWWPRGGRGRSGGARCRARGRPPMIDLAIGAELEAEVERVRGREHPHWAAFGMTEPGAGSDVAAIETSAVRDGDTWVLRGAKTFISNAMRADWIVVWATVDRSAGRAGHRAFVVECGTPGVEDMRYEHKMGLVAYESSSFTLRDCRVPAANLLGGDRHYAERAGFKGAMRSFNATRPAIAAMAIGIARAAFDVARDFARAHYALERPVPRYQRVREQLARMARKIEAGRLLCWRAAYLADLEQPNEIEASMAKAFAAGMAQEATGLAVEILGDAGVTADAYVEKLYRDVKAMDIVEGTGQIQRIVIARRLVGLPR